MVEAVAARANSSECEFAGCDHAHELPSAVLGEDAAGSMDEHGCSDHDDDVQADDDSGEETEEKQKAAEGLNDGHRMRTTLSRAGYPWLELFESFREAIDDQLLYAMGEQDDAQDYPCGEKREITTHDGQEAVHDSPGGARAVSMMSVGARLLTV